MNTYYEDGINFSIEEHVGHVFPQSQHLHSLYEIYYLVQGEISYFIDDRIYTVTNGDIVIIPPNTIHKTTDTFNIPRKRVLIYLDKTFLSDFQELSLWENTSIINTSNSERINTIFAELLSEYNGVQNNTLLKSLICELVVLLQRKNDTRQNVVGDDNQSKRISEIIAYINLEYSSEVTLQKVASNFFVHPGYLSRVFKDGTGMTFSDYLRKYRIKKAIELMSGSDKNITDIAFDVGFNSTNHFCKAFKAVMNISPLKYKKQIRK